MLYSDKSDLTSQEELQLFIFCHWSVLVRCPTSITMFSLSLVLWLEPCTKSWFTVITCENTNAEVHVQSLEQAHWEIATKTHSRNTFYPEPFVPHTKACTLERNKNTQKSQRKTKILKCGGSGWSSCLSMSELMRRNSLWETVLYCVLYVSCCIIPVLPEPSDSDFMSTKTSRCNTGGPPNLTFPSNPSSLAVS